MSDPRYSVTVDGEALDDELTGLLTRLEVRESDGEPGVAALRFQLMQVTDGSFAPLDLDLFRPSARVRVDVEPPGGRLTTLFHGTVTHLRPHFEAIESSGYLEVLAMDAGALLDLEERAQVYDDLTDDDIVRRVFERYDLAVAADATPRRRDATAQRGTDWALVQRLARRNGFVCYLEPDADTGEVSARFGPRALRGPAQADLTILREEDNLAWVDLQWRVAAPTRARAAALDPVTRRVVRADGAPTLPPLGADRVDALAARGLAEAGVADAAAWLRDATPGPDALRAEVDAATDRGQFTVEARGELDPARYGALLRARRTALVKGVGRTLTGLYYVRSVKTVIDKGALTQTFVAERNALGLAGDEDVGRRAEEVSP